MTQRSIPAVALLLAGPPLLDRSKGRHQTKRDTKTDDGSGVISSDLKHRANDARDGLSSYSNGRDQNDLNGCCTAMWKANGKITTLSLFLDSLSPKTEIPYIYARCFLRRQNNPEVNYSPNRISGGSVSGGNFMQALQEEEVQSAEGTSQLQDWNMECKNLEAKRQIGELENGNAEEQGVCSRCQ